MRLFEISPDIWATPGVGSSYLSKVSYGKVNVYKQIRPNFVQYCEPR